jgi:hypothetical protein
MGLSSTIRAEQVHYLIYSSLREAIGVLTGDTVSVPDNSNQHAPSEIRGRSPVPAVSANDESVKVSPSRRQQ